MAASKQTEARWRALVREQEASGRSVKAFADTLLHTYWRDADGRVIKENVTVR